MYVYIGPYTFRPFNIFGLLFLDEEQKTVKSIPCLVFLPKIPQTNKLFLIPTDPLVHFRICAL